MKQRGQFWRDFGMAIVAFFAALIWLIFGGLIERITGKPFGWN